MMYQIHFLAWIWRKERTLFGYLLLWKLLPRCFSDSCSLVSPSSVIIGHPPSTDHWLRLQRRVVGTRITDTWAQGGHTARGMCVWMRELQHRLGPGLTSEWRWAVSLRGPQKRKVVDRVSPLKTSLSIQEIQGSTCAYTQRGSRWAWGAHEARVSFPWGCNTHQSGLTSEIYFHTIPEAGSPRRRCWQGGSFRLLFLQCVFKNIHRTSPVVHWLGIHLPMQRTRVPFLVGEDPTSLGTTKPECHNYWAHSLEPRSCNCWAHVLRFLKPAGPRACALQEKPAQWEAWAPQLERSPYLPQLKKAHVQQQRPSAAKNNKQNIKKLFLKIHSLSFVLLIACSFPAL